MQHAPRKNVYDNPLAALRTDVLRLSQADFALLVGLDAVAVSRMENGSRAYPVDFPHRLREGIRAALPDAQEDVLQEIDAAWDAYPAWYAHRQHRRREVLHARMRKRAQEEQES